MSIILKTNLESSEGADVHLLPAQIDYNGDAKVSKYFTGSMSKTCEEDILKSSFRGRPLAGKVLKIPENYKGFVVKEKVAAASDHQDRQLSANETFQKFTYWNLETSPTSNDAIMNAFHWLDVASVIHEPVQCDQTS